MRLILDPHVSGRRVGSALLAAGHDVRATDAEGKVFDAMDDERLLEAAASEERILISRNVRDFPRIAGEWAQTKRSHAGIVMIPPSIDHAEFRTIALGVEMLLAGTEQTDWRNRLGWITRAAG